jgi:hypothetical protein
LFGPDHHRDSEDGDPIAELVEEHVELDRDVMELSSGTWAIHGYLAYDGEVVAATFATEQEAWAALSHLDEIERE